MLLSKEKRAFQSKASEKERKMEKEPYSALECLRASIRIIKSNFRQTQIKTFTHDGTNAIEDICTTTIHILSIDFVVQFMLKKEFELDKKKE